VEHLACSKYSRHGWPHLGQGCYYPVEKTTISPAYVGLWKLESNRFTKFDFWSPFQHNLQFSSKLKFSVAIVIWINISMSAKNKNHMNEVLTPVLFPPSPNSAEAILRISSLMVAWAEHFLEVLWCFYNANQFCHPWLPPLH